MEEILASIRRIISQESQQGRDGERRSEAAVATTADARPQAPAATDVLLLTEMLAEDGSVISLAEVRAAASGRAGVSPPYPDPSGSATSTPLGPPAGPAAMPAVSDDKQLESPAVTSETDKKDALVSQESRAAAAAAFAELSRHVARERDAAVGGGRTVEELVREALDPMLKNWLDTHLPSMVERIIRQEIQRVVRQADDVA